MSSSAVLKVLISYRLITSISIFTFAFPDNDCNKFDRHNNEYFLGPIVTFQNEDGRQEVIDGQQRLTTLMLLLRAFYTLFGNMNDEASKTTRRNIEQCIWKTDEFDHPDMNSFKLESEVATDDAKEELKQIQQASLQAKHTVLICLANPWSVSAVAAEAKILTFSPAPAFQQAAAETLVGKLLPAGRLPVVL